MLCLYLSRNDGLRMLGNLSSVFLTTGPAAGEKKVAIGMLSFITTNTDGNQLEFWTKK